MSFRHLSQNSLKQSLEGKVFTDVKRMSLKHACYLGDIIFLLAGRNKWDTRQNASCVSRFVHVPSQYRDIVAARRPRRGREEPPVEKERNGSDRGIEDHVKKETRRKLLLSNWKFTHLATKLLQSDLSFIPILSTFFFLHLCVFDDPFVGLLPRPRIHLPHPLSVLLFSALSSRSLFATLRKFW